MNIFVCDYCKHARMNCEDCHNFDCFEGVELAAPSGWRDVREELPEQLTKVLITDGHRIGFGLTTYANEWAGKFAIIEIEGNVTHWMPLPALPAPPKEG